VTFSKEKESFIKWIFGRKTFIEYYQELDWLQKSNGTMKFATVIMDQKKKEFSFSNKLFG
jgi:hypothetical protein